MKILMIAIASSYTPNMGYQENLLSKAFVDKGHQVIIISDNYCFENGQLSLKNEETFYDDKVLVVRKKYKFFLTSYLSGKIRFISKLEKFISEINPDLIFHHGLATLSMIQINQYAKKNNIKYIVDSHEDYNNSATNFISKIFLHKMFYRLIILLSDKHISKYYYISHESKKFIVEMYKIKESKTKYLPLGYYSEEDTEQILKDRIEIRSSYGILQDDLVFIHTGKFDSKKNTISILEIFSKLKNSNLKLFIIGKILDNKIENLINEMLYKDQRITFIPWINTSELNRYISASDIYLQPGTQSATFHLAASKGNLLVSSRNFNYQILYGESIIYIDQNYSLNDFFKEIIYDKSLIKMSECSKRIAIEKLNYISQVDIIINDLKMDSK